jgi:acetyl-CoA C-acetyltransferase
MTHGATVGAHAVRHAIERAGLAPGEVDDVLIGSAFPEGATGHNIGAPDRDPCRLPGQRPRRNGQVVFCSSGLQTIALAAQRIIAGEAETFVAGGVESISCVQNEMNKHMLRESWLVVNKPAIYWPMLETAENVARRYGISREGAGPVRRAQPAARGRSGGQRTGSTPEIVPLTVTMGVADKESNRLYTREVTLASDEGIRGRYHLRRRGADQARAARRRHRRRQRQPVLRRRSGMRLSSCDKLAAEAWPRGAGDIPAASPSPAANPTKWASDRSLPYRSCSREPA